MTSEFRSKIHPYPRVARYATGWAGCRTFDAIYADLTHYASNVMKRNGFRPHEIPECLQNGFMVLWETLAAQYRHTVCVAGAIRAQLDGKSYQQAALDLGKNPKTFPRYMKRATRMLAAAYA